MHTVYVKYKSDTVNREIILAPAKKLISIERCISLHFGLMWNVIYVELNVSIRKTLKSKHTCDIQSAFLKPLNST